MQETDMSELALRAFVLAALTVLLFSVTRLSASGILRSAPEATASAPTEARIPPDALARIRAAAPDEAPARPAHPRHLLVYTACRGFVHGSIPYCTAALQVLGEKTGAFEVTTSDDPEVFRPASLARFDAICFNNTTGELFSDEELKRSLLDFVRGGKGVVGIHAATDCFYDWAEYGDLMGGYFDGHPWNETVAVKLDEPDHPLNAAFGGRSFEIADEIYQFKLPYARDRLCVLLSLDTTRTDMSKKGIKRSDNDFAVSWVQRYGDGRVFYCSLGHREEIFWNPAVLRHYLAGVQFALGDLEADATPSMPPVSDEWLPLFNGRDLTGWLAKEGSWVVEDGVLARRGGGDIWTRSVFGDFELELEFKLAEKTNSGIFFRTGDIRDPVQTGIELQVLDSWGKESPDAHDCGAIYDCLAPRKNAVRKPGEWNQVRLTCRGRQIRVVLNDEPIIDMDLDRWTQAGRNPDGTPNKFRAAYRYMPRVGRIGFQDHGSPVWYRNVRIRVLTPGGAPTSTRPG
jgi:type 1 glutamine amidotransferase